MALKTPSSAFELYIESHPGLKAKFDSGTTGMTKAAYGSHHWKTHGRKEAGRISPGSLRSSDEGTRTSSAFAAAQEGISLDDYNAGRRPSRAASTEAWKTRSGDGAYALAASGTTDPNEWQQYVDVGQPAGLGSHQPGQSWAWTLRGELEDYVTNRGKTQTKRVMADMNGESGYFYLQNPEEEDPGEQNWVFRSSMSGTEADDWSRVPWVRNIKIYEQGEGTDPADDTYAMGEPGTAAVTPPVVTAAAPAWESAFADLLANLTSILNKPATSTPMTETNYGLENTQIVKRQLDDPSLKTSTLTMVNARAPVGGMAVVDPSTGTVYANPGAARAAGITSWVYKYKYDAISTGTSTYTAMAT
jgi:hypothetical protein